VIREKKERRAKMVYLGRMACLDRRDLVD